MRIPTALSATLCTALLATALGSAGAPARATAQARCMAPRVVLVVDRSSSMSAWRSGLLPSGDSKWGAARRAVGELARDFASVVDFGVALFPAIDGANRCDPGGFVLGVAPHSAAEVMDALPAADPPRAGNWTPTSQTLDVLAAADPLVDPARDRHVVLVTDGQQCCIRGTACLREQRLWPVASVMALRALGVYVHVIGFGRSVDALALNRAAAAGGTAPAGCDLDGDDPAGPGPCYHQADDLEGLRIAIGEIARFVTAEACDGYDNDCDGAVDEDFDLDEDRFTTCGADLTTPGRAGGVGPVDCDDRDPRVHPGAAERCNGVDDDCDGEVDPGCACLGEEARPCGSHAGRCAEGLQSCADGGWGRCEDAVLPADGETCDGYDEDCDGALDEGAICGADESCVAGACLPLGEPDPVLAAGGCCAVAGGAPRPSGGRPAVPSLVALLSVALVIARARRRRR